MMAMAMPAMAQVEFHTGGLDALYSSAKRQDKLVFMDLYASWCPPCKTMESTVFSREDVGEFMASNFVSAKYNVDDQLGNEIANKYQVHSIPTYLIFTPDGEFVGRMAGAMSPADFVASMSKFLRE